MAVRCHLYSLVAYPWGKKLAMPNNWEALWAQEAVWTFCKRDTAVTATENRTIMIYVLQITNHAPSRRPEGVESLSAYIFAYELHIFVGESCIVLPEGIPTLT
jgi:hypothetical protein